MADNETSADAYDPESPTPPEREPPIRSTAPQREFTGGQVALGLVVLVIGLALTFGLGLVLA